MCLFKNAQFLKRFMVISLPLKVNLFKNEIAVKVNELMTAQGITRYKNLWCGCCKDDYKSSSLLRRMVYRIFLDLRVHRCMMGFQIPYIESMLHIQPAFGGRI